MITRIQDDLKQAMRDKDSTKLNVLRALKSSITNASLQKGNIDEPVSNSEIIGIVRKEVSKRQDSINSFVSAKRFDLVAKETSEIEILNGYLPIPSSQQELDDIIKNAITELGASSKKDIGKIIKISVERDGGRTSTKEISKRILELLQ